MRIIVYAMDMKTYFEKSTYFLFLGLFFVFVGCNLLVVFLSPLTACTYLIGPNILLLIGLTILYVSLTGKRRTFITFVGLLLCSLWLLLLLTSSQIIPLTMVELWPIMLMLSGLMLIPLGFIRYKFLPISFIVCALALLCIGILFLLFSLNIIESSITDFASQWWPLIFIVFGLSLIALFFYTQKHEQEKWVKNSDDFED